MNNTRCGATSPDSKCCKCCGYCDDKDCKRRCKNSPDKCGQLNKKELKK